MGSRLASSIFLQTLLLDCLVAIRLARHTTASSTKVGGHISCPAGLVHAKRGPVEDEFAAVEAGASILDAHGKVMSLDAYVHKQVSQSLTWGTFNFATALMFYEEHVDMYKSDFEEWLSRGLSARDQSVDLEKFVFHIRRRLFKDAKKELQELWSTRSSEHGRHSAHADQLEKEYLHLVSQSSWYHKWETITEYVNRGSSFTEYMRQNYPHDVYVLSDPFGITEDTLVMSRRAHVGSLVVDQWRRAWKGCPEYRRHLSYWRGRPAFAKEEVKAIQYSSPEEWQHINPNDKANGKYWTDGKFAPNDVELPVHSVFIVAPEPCINLAT